MQFIANLVLRRPWTIILTFIDTIHFLSRYNRAIEDGHDTVTAVNSALVGTGRAMVLSTVFLVAGFSIYLAASYLAVVYLTIVILTVLVTAIVGDLLVLPAMLIYFAPNRSKL